MVIFDPKQGVLALSAPKRADIDTFDAVKRALRVRGAPSRTSRATRTHTNAIQAKTGQGVPSTRSGLLRNQRFLALSAPEMWLVGVMNRNL